MILDHKRQYQMAMDEEIYGFEFVKEFYNKVEDPDMCINYDFPNWRYHPEEPAEQEGSQEAESTEAYKIDSIPKINEEFLVRINHLVNTTHKG